MVTNSNERKDDNYTPDNYFSQKAQADKNNNLKGGVATYNKKEELVLNNSSTENNNLESAMPENNMFDNNMPENENLDGASYDGSEDMEDIEEEVEFEDDTTSYIEDENGEIKANMDVKLNDYSSVDELTDPDLSDPSLSGINENFPNHTKFDGVITIDEMIVPNELVVTANSVVTVNKKLVCNRLILLGKIRGNVKAEYITLYGKNANIDGMVSCKTVTFSSPSNVRNKYMTFPAYVKMHSLEEDILSNKNKTQKSVKSKKN